MFQAAYEAPEAEGRTPTSSFELVSHSSSDSGYCLHPHTTSTVPVSPAQRVVADALHTIDLIEQEIEGTDAIITMTCEEIQELKNRQDWTEHLLNNIFCSCHGKPVVTCMAMQAP